jgi:hypothetical protein
MTDKNSSQAARDALLNLLKSDDEGLVLQAAQSLLHHSGLFMVMDSNDEEETLLQFMHWLRENKHIKLEVKSFNSFREVVETYIEDPGALEHDDDDGEGDLLDTSPKEVNICGHCQRPIDREVIDPATGQKYTPRNADLGWKHTEAKGTRSEYGHDPVPMNLSN